MNKQNKIKIVVFLLLGLTVLMQYFACSNPNSKTIYYKDFDLFYLEGLDTIQKVDKQQFVEVVYENNFPIIIKYYLEKRTVSLSLIDSFISKNNQSVYVFSSDNYFGGLPDNQKKSRDKLDDFNYLFYITLTDTIICESLTYPSHSDYIFNLLIKRSNHSVMIKSFGEKITEKNATIERRDLYVRMLNILRHKYKSDTNQIRIIDIPPPE